MRTIGLTTILGLMALATLLGGCDEVRANLEVGIPASGDKPFGELNPVDDMHDQSALKAQEEESLIPAPLTVPRDMRRYPAEVAADKSLAAATLKNPLPITRQNLERGQDLYMSYCMPCHGDRGLGNGTIIPKFSKPPALTSRKLRNEWSDGDLFHVISQGQNIMPSYANQLKPMERWAVVNYIRALQRAEYPTQSDVERLSKISQQ